MRVQSRVNAFRTLTKTKKVEDRVTERGYDSSSAPIYPATTLEGLGVECPPCEYATYPIKGRGQVVQLQRSSAMPGLYCSLTSKYVS